MVTRHFVSVSSYMLQTPYYAMLNHHSILLTLYIHTQIHIERDRVPIWGREVPTTGEIKGYESGSFGK